MRAALSTILFICFTLTACSTSQKTTAVPATDERQRIYADHLFPKAEHVAIETEQEVFGLDDEMQAFVSAKLKSRASLSLRAEKLVEKIFSEKDMNLIYESGNTTTASQTYHSKQANCMSLTIMAFSLAKAANLDAHFQDVYVPEYWERHGDYSAIAGHVNLLIKVQNAPNAYLFQGTRSVEIDFDPYLNKKKFPSSIITQQTMLGLFYNNKGAEALVQGRLNSAYRYLKEATLIAPQISSTWGNMGILYRITGNHNQAFLAYQMAIDIKPDNYTAMSNLAKLYKRNGQTKEGNDILRELHNMRLKNPYYHALLAEEAYFKGDLEDSIKHYRKAIRLDKSIHEFYFKLATVYSDNNQIDKAKSAIKHAIRLNRTPGIETQYVAKLQMLAAR